MSNTVALLRTDKSRWRIVRSLQTVSVANAGSLFWAHTECASHYGIRAQCVTVRTIRTNRNGPYAKSSWRIVRSVQTVKVAYGPYSEHIRSVHLIMTSGHSILSVRTVRSICRNRNGPYAWLIRTVLIPRCISYISHKAKPAHSNSNIPRSISHKPQQARSKCNIPRSISRKLQEARSKCNIPRSISHKPQEARSKCNIPRSISHKPEESRSKCNIPRSISYKPQKARFKYNTSRSIGHKVGSRKGLDTSQKICAEVPFQQNNGRRKWRNLF